MLQEERFGKIIEYLKVNETAKIPDLAKLVCVSVDTIRRDLEKLEEYGVLDRVRGGAVWRRESLEQHVYEMRSIVHSEEKEQLAALVGKVLDDGKTVVMGSSSTTVEIAKYISQNYKRLTVITNDMDIVKKLSTNEHVKLIVMGGTLDQEENATYGRQCEKEVKQYNADVCIISVNGISVEKGLSDFRLNQMDTFKAMMDISEKVVVAADSSKFNKASCMALCSLDEVDCIISDDKLPKEMIKKLEEMSIEVITP